MPWTAPPGGKLPFIVKLGNLAVHTERAVQSDDTLLSLRGLFEFILWVDYCYGTSYEERQFDESGIPTERVIVDTKKIKEQESLLGEKDAAIETLRRQIQEMSAQLTAAKVQHQQERSFAPEDPSKFTTRKWYIDLDMKLAGSLLARMPMCRRNILWRAWPEWQVRPILRIMLFGKDGLPLAVVEAKRTSKDPNSGRKQAMLYADCLECKFGRRPMMFTTNAYETYFWDDQSGPQRPVSGIFSKDDLQKLMNRRSEQMDLLSVSIDDQITGKTRTASSLADVLSRGSHATNILFLADRTALVKQARDDFKKYLPDMSLCNLCTNKDDRSARIVFSTYPTIFDAIDGTKTKDGKRLFTPTHFDLIIIDESHRSIFKKYRAIFEYFDAIMVGLTATPKTDVDRNTYDFFEMEHGVPTYAYDYETAVEQDHVLVPYYNYEVKTQFLEEEITYDDLSDEDKAR